MRKVVAFLLLSAACSSGPTQAGDLDERFEFRGLDIRLLGGAVLAASEVDVDLREVVEDTVRTVGDAIRIPPIIVTVQADATTVREGWGVGGEGPNFLTGDVAISIDPGASDLADLLTQRLPATMATWLYTSTRWQRTERSRSLLTSIVNLGLADHFAHEVFPSSPRGPWVDALDADDVRATWDRAEPELDEDLSGEEIDDWFFGEGDLPMWAGNAIGFHLIAAYLEAEDVTATEALEVPASTVFERSGFDP